MDLTVIIKIAAIGFITAICGMLLKKVGKDEIATLVAIAGLIVSLVLLADMVMQIYSDFGSLFDLQL